MKKLVFLLDVKLHLTKKRIGLRMTLRMVIMTLKRRIKAAAKAIVVVVMMGQAFRVVA